MIDDGVGLIEPTAGQWDFLALTYDGAAIRFYRNGILVKSLAATGGIAASSYPVRLGAYAFDGTNPFRGLLDDVRMFNRALSIGEIQTLYVQGGGQLVVSTLAGQAGVNGSANGTGSGARFERPSGVAVDSAGNVYVADTNNHLIRKITSAGIVSTLAGSTIGSNDGTGTGARFNWPQGIAVDASGNVYVADTYNGMIRKITPAGVVTTLAGPAAEFSRPYGITVDATGNVYVGDAATKLVLKISSAGVVSTLAGQPGVAGSADGTGSGARFNSPAGVAVDSTGNVYVADSGNHTIRKITSAGVVTTLAGSAGVAGAADGVGSVARFNFPYGLAIGPGGNLYVADATNHTLRLVTPAGTVTTLAGLAGSAGTADGTGSVARFNSPVGLAVDTAGTVYVADYLNHAIRKGASAAAASQTITFGALATKTFGDAPFTLTATASSGLPVSYVSSNPAVATVSSSGVVTIVGAGSTNITASQPGNANYLAATDVVQALIVTASGSHSADSNGAPNFRIDLIELTRVIALYNVRNGTVRTGRYLVQATGTEDGFSVDPTTPNLATVTLTLYHSADSNHDGKLSLTEVTRVIELYNFRVGTNRTGDYHVHPGSEDGFAPGPLSVHPAQ